jgi:hypothetical protein
MNSMSKRATFEEVLEFLNNLDGLSVKYRIDKPRRDSVMIEFATPGYRWEVEFFPDKTIEVEKFVSDGGVRSDLRLEDLLKTLGT